MDLDEVGALTRHWAAFPPAHVALRRLENVARALGGAPPAERPPLQRSLPPSRRAPRDEASMAAWVGELNARA